MATTFLAATPIQDTFLLPGTNTPGNGVQLFCYAAGSSTKTTVYKDNAGATPHTNPIVLDSGGNIPSGGEVWQTQGQSMKYVYAPSNDTDPPASPYRTLDNMPGTNDVSAQTGVEWLSGPTPTFVSSTQFTLVGDQTATFTKGRRVKTTNTGGTVYSTIVGSAFGALTTITLVNDSGALDAGLSAVSYGLFEPTNVSISSAEIYRKGANVSSATSGTTDIWGIVGDYAHVAGTTAIRNFSTAPYAGMERTLIFDSALTVFSSAALAIPGNWNYRTAPNDRMTVRADTTTNAVVTNIVPAAGLAQFSALNKAIYGFTYANNAGDATNDLDIAAGGAMDATGAYWMTGAALTKQSDVNWAVGTAAGALDTGAVANSDYYIWVITRSDTGVVDYLFSLSSTAPTMPANYDFKRLIGWFKRVGGTIVAFTTYETEGGGLELIWTSPTLDINLANTLTTARRTDAVKVPVNFSTLAHINVVLNDAGAGYQAWIYCPDQTDLAPSVTVAPLANMNCTTANLVALGMKIRTSATGTIAARATIATVDLYAVVTLGFTWARRN